LRFFDIYLDAIVITNKSVFIYKWFGLFKSTTDVIDFEAIESVFADQSWLWDIIFNKWDIYFRRAWHDNIFKDVPNPWKVANDINTLIWEIQKENDLEESEEKTENDVKILAEVLADLLREYKNTNRG